MSRAEFKLIEGEEAERALKERMRFLHSRATYSARVVFIGEAKRKPPRAKRRIRA